MGFRCWLALAASLLLTAATDAAELRIRYAETVLLPGGVAPGAAKPGAGPSLSFTAYGRAFQTDLEANSRVLRSLSPQRQRQLGVIPYKGSLAGIAGSWVRLTRNGEQYSGAIWDGAELYLIAPAREAAPLLQTPMDVAADGVLIFRLADTEGGALGGACGASSASAAAANGSERYRALLSELAGATPLAAAAIQGEIEVSVLGDAQFGARYSANAAATMVSRMNVVDGIFAESLGIFIVPTDLTVFDNGDDPFTGTDSINLLSQVGVYRNGRPALAARAITHLMTGRDLTGNTIGIGYLNGICDARYGASLSEAGSSGDPTAPLIIAHELGHNFGAPHDNEPGSPCAGTPGFWLMNPYINGSDEFSACSVQQMQPVISAASCVLPARIADVAVTVDTPSISAPTNRPYSFPVTVTALGDQPAEDVRLSINAASGNFSAESVTAPAGVTCTAGGSVNCSFGTLAAAESRQVIVNMRATEYPGTSSATARVSARVDRDSANNSQTLTLNIFAGSDVSIAMVAPVAGVLVGDIFEMSFDAAADGIEAAANVAATISLPSFMTIDSAVAAGGSCPISAPYYRVTCTLGNVPNGERRRIVVRAHATQGAGTYPAVASVRADNDGSSLNNQLSFSIPLSPRQDVGVVTPAPGANLVVGVPFDYVVNVTSPGVEAAANVTVHFGVDPQLTVLQATTTAGTCQVSGSIISCSLGALAAGASSTVTVRLLASQARNYYTSGSVSATRNDNRSNDSINGNLVVRYTSDVRLDGAQYATHVEGRGQLYVRVESVGHNAASNVVVRALLPAGYPIAGATIPNGTCTVTDTTAECVVPSMATGPGSSMTVEYTSAAPGTFTANFSVSASADGDPANNQMSTIVTLEPYIDVRVDSAPERIDAAPGEVINLPFVIAADRRAVNGVTFYASGFYNMTLQSVSVTGGGSCTNTSSTVMCTLGDLSANGTRAIAVSARITPDLAYSFTSTIYARANAGMDRNFENDTRYVPVNVALRGDAALSVAQASVSATRMQSFDLPTVTVTGVRTVENVEVQFTLPVNMVLVSTSLGGCFAQGSLVRCSLGTIPAGVSQNLNLRLQPTAAGNSTINVQLVAAGDENTQNNQGSIAVTASDPPSTNNGGGSGGGGGGGGGGGAIGWQALLALLLLHAARRRQRFQLTPPR